MRQLLVPLALAVTLWGCNRDSVTNDSPAEPSVVEGRVVDDSGAGVANVELRLTDTTRRSGYVDSRGCGTYHLQESTHTGPDGRFRVELPFTPNEVAVNQAPEDFDPPRNALPVTAGEQIEVTLRRIPWLNYEGQVVDEQGAPLAQVRIDQLGMTDEAGRFKFRLDPEKSRSEFRFRKIGFKPTLVPDGELTKVVLRERRALVTVKLVDEKTKQPAGWLYRVELFRGEERLSFCTAGDMKMTHEPAEGECTLDADPGTIELKVERKLVRKLQVTDVPQTVTVEVAPPPPPPTGNPY